MADFVAEFSPLTMSPEQDCIVSAQWEEESSEAKSVEIKSVLEGHEVIKEIPQNAEVTIAREITGVLEVNIEPPQIYLSSAWKMFIDGAKNSLEAGVGVVLKVPEGQFFSVASG